MLDQFVSDRFLSRALPTQTIGMHLYIDYKTYQALPKPGCYKTFFVLRDPRDIVVSWYFSAKLSHTSVSVIPEFRARLAGLNITQGLRVVIDTLIEWDSFATQASWMNRGVRIFRFEDLVADESELVRKLLDFLEIEIPHPELEDLIEQVRFTSITGRPRDIVDQQSHYRRGITGEWRECFDDATYDYFRQRTGNLLEDLGYEA